jgi:excisionase family DNA binding protein
VIGTAVRTAAAIVTALAVGVRRWYTVTEAAERLGYHRNTILRLLKEGGIDGARQLGQGKHWRVPRAWVDAEMTKGVRAVIRRRTGE